MMGIAARFTRDWTTLTVLGLLLALGWLAWSPRGKENATAQEAAKPAVKWEYCTLSNDQTGACGYNDGKDAIGADDWKDLAKKLKVPLKEGEENQHTIRLVVLNFLGAQGWELVSHSGMVMNATYVETFAFKRRA
jgi:hypothetical protein